MYVVPEMRGNKIARQMLECLIETSKAMVGLEQIHLWVLNPATSIAKKLYLKAGFVGQGLIVKNDLKIDNNFVDAEYMTLAL